MTFEIEVNGRARVVAIEPIGRPDASGGRFHMTIHSGPGDTPRPATTAVVEARRVDRGWSIVREADRRVIDAAVRERPRGGLVIQLVGASVEATVDGRRFRREARDEPAGGEQRTIAPMPGRVVRVLVRPGDEVAAGQGLVVVEAMKMENELVAAGPGRVVDVTVTDGEAVEAGRLLVRLE